jgi:endonuclease YncB( thermonuclease family)
MELILMLAAVLGVVDGETVRVKNDANQIIIVKLACIDVPKRLSQSHSVAATQRLKKLLPSGIPIRISSINKHKNGRAFGEVFVDNRSVNLQLVEEGKAILDKETLYSCYEPEKFIQAEASAKMKKIGLWQQSNSDNRIQPKKQILRGKLVYQEIPALRSTQAYQGEEFILITNSSNANRFVLRPSTQVSRTRLQSFNNQQVEIKAVYIQGTRPSTNQTACPIEADGQCMRQGGGYQVLSIEAFLPKK